MNTEKLTRAQVALKALTDRALAEKRTPMLPFVDFAVGLSPTEVDRQLRQCVVADVLLGDGDSLSAEGSGGYYPDLGLVIGQARLAAVQLRVFGWEYPKYRVDPKGPTTPPLDIIEFPGEKDWARVIEIRLWYTNGTESACQTLSIHTASTSAGKTPSVSRDVIAPSYAETGYEGHNQKMRRGATERDVLEVVRLAQQLFDRRVKPLGHEGVA